jgi:hypothetical protein
MGVKITDLNEVLGNLERLKQKAEALQGGHQIPLNELMPESFIQQHTDFPNLQAMIDASGIENPEDLSGEEWTAFVAAHSQFRSWEHMQQEAVGEWAGRKLGFQ